MCTPICNKPSSFIYYHSGVTVLLKFPNNIALQKYSCTSGLRLFLNIINVTHLPVNEITSRTTLDCDVIRDKHIGLRCLLGIITVYWSLMTTELQFQPIYNANQNPLMVKIAPRRRVFPPCHVKAATGFCQLSMI